MRLLHYSAEPVVEVYSRSLMDQLDDTKPVGLWVSVEDEWKQFCEESGFDLNRTACEHEVVLSPDANILHLSSVKAIDDFTRRYALSLHGFRRQRIRWKQVATRYQGILIAPYCWTRRLCDDTAWYYGWDCASGCIWDAAAIASISLCKPVGEGNG